MIISVLNPKGGSGKTSLAIQLASWLHSEGHNTVLIDTDPQGSARDWQAVASSKGRESVPVMGVDRADGIRQLPGLVKPYAFAVLDGTGKQERSVGEALRVSDAVLIPVKPSGVDVWAVSELVEIIKTRQAVADRPWAGFVISQAVSRTKLKTELTETLGELDLPILESAMTLRQVYAQSLTEGVSVFDTDNAAAKAEVSRIGAELLRRTGKMEQAA